MNRIMLDTSGYIGFMKGHPEIIGEIQSADKILINPIVLGELHAGFLRSGLAKRNKNELFDFLSSSRVSIESIDEETAEKYAVIKDHLFKTGTPIPTNDIWIAASAMQHGLKVITTDKHFSKVVQVISEIF